MTSLKQVEANRRNAEKSTGPTTPEGKQRSRGNALRHGLTAETVIGGLESAEDYAAFETAIMAEYHPRSVIESELVARLASVLWRLRRATAIETGLFEMQADPLAGFRSKSSVVETMVFVGRNRGQAPVSPDAADGRASNNLSSTREHFDRNALRFVGAGRPSLEQCYVRLANAPNFALDRLSRYEANLWRQATQIIFALGSINQSRNAAGRGRSAARQPGMPGSVRGYDESE